MNESIRNNEQVNRRQPLNGFEESNELGPDGQAEVQGLSDSVQSSLRELGAKYRTLVVLKHFQGFSYREISAILQLSESVVKSRLYAARQMMKESLEDRKAF